MMLEDSLAGIYSKPCANPLPPLVINSLWAKLMVCVSQERVQLLQLHGVSIGILRPDLLEHVCILGIQTVRLTFNKDALVVLVDGASRVFEIEAQKMMLEDSFAGIYSKPCTNPLPPLVINSLWAKLMVCVSQERVQLLQLHGVSIGILRPDLLEHVCILGIQ